MSIFRSKSLHKMEAYNSDLKWPCLLFTLKDYTVVHHQNFFLRWRDQTPYILKTQKRGKKEEEEEEGGKKAQNFILKGFGFPFQQFVFPLSRLSTAAQGQLGRRETRPGCFNCHCRRKTLSKILLLSSFCRSCLLTPAFRLVLVSLFLSKLQLIARSLVSERLMLLTAGALTPRASRVGGWGFNRAKIKRPARDDGVVTQCNDTTAGSVWRCCLSLLADGAGRGRCVVWRCVALRCVTGRVVPSVLGPYGAVS